VEQQHLITPPKLFARDLADGANVDSVWVVRDASRKRKRNGDVFLKLQLGDVTGAVEAVAWESVEEASVVATPGAIVRVQGEFAIDGRYGGCLTIRAVRAAADDEYDPLDLIDGPQVDCDQMTRDLRELIATVQDPNLQALLGRFFDEGSELWSRFRVAPAAKRYHQAYRHGLLEHSLSVARGVSAISATFSSIDRDVAVTGALLHDVGKIEAYAIEGGAIELTDAGKLQGEIPLGYHMVRCEIEALPGFPAENAQAILHVILSHHGTLENGSPVLPCTREATLVHMIDNLGGRLGSFDRIEKELATGERWSGFDRALSGSAYFAPREREAA
jgi:3'-5' exoribonuclease